MFMDIPAIYSVYRGGKVKAAPVNIEGADISFVSDPMPLEYSADELDDRMPLLVADVRGLGKGGLDDRLLTNMKFPGSDVWFMTCIKDVEDVFDCFMGNIAKVLMPYHSVRNGIVMEEVYEVTENCIPVLFVSKGVVLHRNEGATGIGTALSELERIGFREIIVFDTDSTLRSDDWASLHEKSPDLIPFVRSKGATVDGIGFQKVIFDL